MSNTPTQTPPAGTEGGLPRWRITLGIVVFLVAGLSLWIYALVFYKQDRKIDELADRTFPTAAEPICAKAVAAIDALPKAPTAKDNRERAAVVRQANEVLTRMVGDLRTVVPDTDDAEGINLWLDHWSIWIDDRADYANRLEADPLARFYVTELNGTHVTKGVDHFAEVNRMVSCETTGDVG